MSDILYPAGLYRVNWAEEHGEHPSFKYLVLFGEVEGVRCYDIASMHKLIENLKRQKITDPFIIYTGVHLPECNTGALRRHDIQSPHLIKIMKDIRDWPLQAVVNLLVEKGISQLLLEDEVLGQADVRDIDFKRVIQNIGFAEAIKRKKKGGKPWKRSKKKSTARLGKFVHEGAYARIMRERAEREEEPPPRNHVWSNKFGQYVHAESEEGKRIINSAPVVSTNTGKPAARVWSERDLRYVDSGTLAVATEQERSSPGVEAEHARMAKMLTKKKSPWQHRPVQKVATGINPETGEWIVETVSEDSEDISEEEYERRQEIRKGYREALKQSLGRNLTEAERKLMSKVEIIIEEAEDEPEEAEEEYYEEEYFEDL